MADKKLNSILIIGATRGIGIELVKQFLQLKPIQVIATYRSFDSATELRKLKIENSNLKLLKLDLIDFNSYDEFASQVDSLVGENGLQILVHNAGILIEEDTIVSVTSENMIDAFKINTISPILLTKHLLHLLKRSSSHTATKAVYMSSILGSIEQNNGKRYSHRISKCGLNQGVVTLAKDLKDYEIEFVLIHPGYVKTEMSNFEGDIDVETSVNGIIKVLFNEKINRNGKLISWNGEIINW